MSASFDFQKDPFAHFEEHFQRAQKQIPKDPNAMSLATVSKEGTPAVRTVLFRGLIREGFSFYTNYKSPKAQDLMATKKAALLFYWPSLDMQIRIQGPAEKLSRAESEKYFAGRPRLSQIGAWASDQSRELRSHEELLEKVDSFQRKFAGQDVPCPEDWGGFHVLPLSFEFWFAHEGRLHERYVYQRKDLKSPWETRVLSP